MEDKRVLHLTIKKKWFDMIASGEKKEEYRNFNDYWQKRLMFREEFIGFNGYEFRHFDYVHFYNGGSPCLKYPNFLIEFKGMDIGLAKPEWSDNWQGCVFRIKLGNIINHKIHN